MTALDNHCVLVASAPLRTADVGGWTDTWFARTGTVCNVAIGRRAEVRIRSADGTVRHPRAVRLDVALTGHGYEVDPEAPPGRHPMLERAIVALPPPAGSVVEIASMAEVGGGLGGSASVLVALVAALAAVRGDGLAPLDVARLAHRFETDAGREAGVQDHVAAAFGGVSAIEVAYPEAAHGAILLGADVLAELERRLVTIVFGAAHSSSDIHREVIARLHRDETVLAIKRIRAAAREAIDALRTGDLAAYGRALRDNHEALQVMHPGTVSGEAHELASIAADCGAAGWKVNGAGGAGGSMVVLGPDDADALKAMRERIDVRVPWARVIAPIDPDGVRTTWEPAIIERDPDDRDRR